MAFNTNLRDFYSYEYTLIKKFGLSPENSVKNKKSFGGTAFSQVKSAIKRARKKI